MSPPGKMLEPASSITISQGPTGHVVNDLAAVVRKIGWSYAILWSSSSKHPGALTWGDGFYNGEIRTMRLKSTSDIAAEVTNFERSKQLKKLYDSLVTGESVKQSAALLSLEDLGEDEWYYMICMSYVFRCGQGLPGRCFARNEYAWIYNAQAADSATFLRALLAKSSSIQTILCIPLKNGALELGTTDLVMEDPDFVNRTIALLTGSNHGLCPYPQEISSHSTTVRAETRAETSSFDIILNDVMTNVAFPDVHEHEWRGATLEQASMNLDDLFEDISTDCFISSPLRLHCMPSSFTAWKKPETCIPQTSFVSRRPNSMLMKVVTGAWRQDGTSRKCGHKENDTKNNALTEKRRRERMKSMILTLGSLVPSVSKVDKASILAETIDHLRELKSRLQELESTTQLLLPNRTESETAMTCGHEFKTPSNSDKVRTNESNKKRKAREMTGDDDSSPPEVNVNVVDKVVQIGVLCRWKDLVMSQVFSTVRRLNLEVVDVQASKSNDLLRMKIKAQPTSSSTVAPGLIGEALLSDVTG